jgi:hypothetical protein
MRLERRPVCPVGSVGRSGFRTRESESAERRRLDRDERTTGTRDEHYDLISVLYHALHGAENCGIYAEDAKAVGDERLADFFREAQAVQRQLAERAKGLLGIEIPPQPSEAERPPRIEDIRRPSEARSEPPRGDIPPGGG